MTLLSPSALLVLVAAAAPLLAIVLVRVRQRRAAAALGLQPTTGRRIAVEAALAAAVFASLALCAATPVMWQKESVPWRSDAEAYVFVDTSSSMLARRTLESPDRLETAQARAAALVAALPPDLPTGLAAFNDQPLPLLAPTVNRDAFRATLAYAKVSLPTAPSFMIAAETGAWDPARARASNYSTLLIAAVARFFAPATTHRLLFLVTDNDTAEYRAARVGRLLRLQGITLVVLRVGSPVDRLFYRSRSGQVKVDERYVFDRRNQQLLPDTVRETGGRFLAGADSVTEAVAYSRHALGEPSQSTAGRLTVLRSPRDLSLIPALTAFATLLVLFVLLGLGNLVAAPPAREG